MCYADDVALVSTEHRFNELAIINVYHTVFLLYGYYLNHVKKAEIPENMCTLLHMHSILTCMRTWSFIDYGYTELEEQCYYSCIHLNSDNIIYIHAHKAIYYVTMFALSYKVWSVCTGYNQEN